jgi:hypothetical protein
MRLSQSRSSIQKCNSVNVSAAAGFKSLRAWGHDESTFSRRHKEDAKNYREKLQLAGVPSAHVHPEIDGSLKVE